MQGDPSGIVGNRAGTLPMDTLSLIYIYFSKLANLLKLKYLKALPENGSFFHLLNVSKMRSFHTLLYIRQ